MVRNSIILFISIFISACTFKSVAIDEYVYMKNSITYAHEMTPPEKVHHVDKNIKLSLNMYDSVHSHKLIYKGDIGAHNFNKWYYVIYNDGKEVALSSLDVYDWNTHHTLNSHIIRQEEERQQRIRIQKEKDERKLYVTDSTNRARDSIQKIKNDIIIANKKAIDNKYDSMPYKIVDEEFENLNLLNALGIDLGMSKQEIEDILIIFDLELEKEILPNKSVVWKKQDFEHPQFLKKYKVQELRISFNKNKAETIYISFTSSNRPKSFCKSIIEKDSKTFHNENTGFYTSRIEKTTYFIDDSYYSIMATLQNTKPKLENVESLDTDYDSHNYQTGKRGGQYYINSKGNKVYKKK